MPSDRTGWTRRLAAATCLVLCLSTVAVGLRNNRNQLAYLGLVVPLVRQHAAGGSFQLLSTHLCGAFPLVNYAGVSWASRFAIPWPIVDLGHRYLGVLTYESAEQRKRFETYKAFFMDAIVADLARWKPKVVFVDGRRTKPYFGGLEFDYIDFPSTDPRFAKIWSGYELLIEPGGFVAYARTDAADGTP